MIKLKSLQFKFLPFFNRESSLGEFSSTVDTLTFSSTGGKKNFFLQQKVVRGACSLSLSLQLQTKFHGANDEFNFLQKDIRDASQEGPSLTLFKFEWSFEAPMTD